MVQRTKKPCSVDECKNPVVGRGWCSTHYYRWQKYGDPHKLLRDFLPQHCSIECCEGKRASFTWCRKHYLRWWKNGSTDLPEKEVVICAVETCSSAASARGWCSKHYSRWRKTGDPEKTLYDIRPSFDSYIEERGECLIWTGTLNDEGYGNWFHNGKQVKAHRFAWERVNGVIPRNKVMDHICHTPACVNPKHLRLATRAQNSWHKKGPQPYSSSGIRNVNRAGNKWKVIIKKNGHTHYFGTFDTPEEARPVAEAARRKLFGEFAGRS